MPKTKRRKRRGKKPHIKMIKCGSETQESTKVNFWNKQLSTKQQILMTVSIIIIIILVFMTSTYLSGKRIINAQGYDSSEEAITGYLTAMSANNAFELQRCYDLYSINGRSLYSSQLEIAKMQKKSTVLDTAGIDIETHEYRNLNDIVRNTKNENITCANMSQVMFNIDKTVDDMTYTQKCLYRFITYESNSKWYIYAQQETASITVKAADKNGKEIQMTDSHIDMTDTVKVGDDTVGYISVGADWQETDSSETLGTERMYRDPNSTAQISLAIAGTQTNVKVFAQELYDTLKESDNLASSVTMTETELNSYPAVLISCSDIQTGQMFSAWIFEAPDHDNNVHYITLEHTADNTSATNYVHMFRF